MCNYVGLCQTLLDYVRTMLDYVGISLNILKHVEIW